MIRLFPPSLPREAASSPESSHHYDFNFATPQQKAAAAKAHQVAKSFMLFGENRANAGKSFLCKKKLIIKRFFSPKVQYMHIDLELSVK